MFVCFSNFLFFIFFFNKILSISAGTLKALGCTHTDIFMCFHFFQRRATWWREQRQTSRLPLSMWRLPLSPHWCCFCVWAQLRLKCESSEASGLQNTSHNQTGQMNNSEHFLCQEEEQLKSAQLSSRRSFSFFPQLAADWVMAALFCRTILCHLIVLLNSVLLFPHANTLVSSEEQRIYTWFIQNFFFDEWALASFVSTNCSFLLLIFTVFHQD